MKTQLTSVMMRAVLVLMAGLMLLMLNTYPSAILAVVLVGILGVGIWSRRSVFFYLYFALVCGFQFYPPGYYLEIQLPELDWNAFKFACVAIVFMATGFRFLESSRFEKAFAVPGEPDVRELIRTARSLLLGRWLLIPGAVMIAVGGLYFGRADPELGFKVGIVPQALRLISIVVVLFVVWVLFDGELTVLRRSKMSRTEAGVSFRSMFAREFWRDQASLEKRRVKNRRRAIE